MGALLTPVAVWIGSKETTMRNAHLVVSIDRWMTRVSRGRLPLLKLVGLCELTLLVPGRKSGVERSTPLLCASWRNGFVVVGSNWGQDRAPLWVGNLRAADAGTVAIAVEGMRIPVDVTELQGDDRRSGWAAAQREWPNYELYQRRTDRVLPVFHLTPRL